MRKTYGNFNEWFIALIKKNNQFQLLQSERLVLSTVLHPCMFNIFGALNELNL